MERRELHSASRSGPNWQATWSQHRRLVRDESGELVGVGSYQREVEGEVILTGEPPARLVGEEIEIGELAPGLRGRVVVTDGDPLPSRSPDEHETRWCFRFFGRGEVLLENHNPLDEPPQRPADLPPI
ncbi:MAG: hypothetical protein ACOCTI_03755 [Phycisphaeraceae bacterium]